MTTAKKMTSKHIGTLALEAMLFEVSATPKPGLVDRNNSGAHRDMCFFTFLRSAASLRSCFEEFAEAGFNAGSDGIAPAEVFPELRQIGIRAESDMFDATEGINTHKGEIFSLGVVSASAGYLVGSGHNLTAESVLRLCGEICAGLCEHDFAGVRDKADPTKGERVYIEYGIAGIRGEAESGYPCVRDYGLPALRKYIAEGFSMNDALVMALMRIMAVNQDTNIISRHDFKTLQEVMRLAENVTCIHDVYMLDDEFISRNISPSGSADLLAVTYLVHSLDAQ